MYIYFIAEEFQENTYRASLTQSVYRKLGDRTRVQLRIV